MSFGEGLLIAWTILMVLVVIVKVVIDDDNWNFGDYIGSFIANLLLWGCVWIFGVLIVAALFFSTVEKEEQIINLSLDHWDCIKKVEEECVTYVKD